MAAVFDFLTPDDSAIRAAVIDALVLDGKPLQANVGMAIQDIPFERTIEGASTVTLALIDPDGELLDSGLFSAAVDIELPSPTYVIPKGQSLPVPVGDSLGFRLVRIKTSGAILSLEFEDREVASVRGHKEVRHASRADMTRAMFIRSLVRAVGGNVRFWSPELRVVQPIRSIRDIEAKRTKQTKRSPGFGDAVPKVKGRDASKQQIRYLEQILDATIAKGGGRREMIGIVECVTQESVVINDLGQPSGPGGTEEVNVGLFHQSSVGWPATRDPVKDANGFLAKFLPIAKAHKDQSIGWCVDETQRSYTYGTSQQGRDYDQWENEARATVNAYTGDDPAATRLEEVSTYIKRYEYRTTEPNADHRTDWWTATANLAKEVNFRRFIDYGVFHYVSDDYLRKAAPRLIVDRKNLPAGILKVDIGDFDTGKPRRNVQGQNVGGATVRVDVLMDVLAPPLGGVWVLKGYGPCDGPYLIENVRGSYLSPRATVTMTLPIPLLPEPASQLAQRSVQGDPHPTGALPKPDGLTPKQIIDRIVLPIARANHIRVTASTVESANERHSELTTSGNVSDHKGPPTRAWAADMSDNWAATNGSPNMTKLAQALADRFEIDWHGKGLVDAVHNGYRYQLIYRTTEGGNHYNHVHFGVKVVGPHAQRTGAGDFR